MAEMKSLNGNEIVDAKARKRLDDIEKNGVGGGVDSTKVEEISQEVAGRLLNTHNEDLHAHPAIQEYLSELIETGNINLRTELLEKISAIPKFNILVVEELPYPTEASLTTLYLYPVGLEDPDVYQEYICVEYEDGSRTFELLGTQTIDLSQYSTTEEMNAVIEAKIKEAKESGEFDGYSPEITLSRYPASDTAPGGVDIVVKNKDGTYTAQKVSDGKSAYEYAQEGGYTGTETDFLDKLAKEVLPEIYIGEGTMPEGAVLRIVAGKSDVSPILESRIVQQAGNSTALVMSQKAVTDLVSNALGSGGETVEYETVDSVEEMTDTSKQYILSTTGTLWAYGEFEVGAAELYDPGAVSLGYRHASGATGPTTSNAGTYVMTDYIPVDMTVAEPKLQVHGAMNAQGGSKPNFEKIGYYDSSKTCLGSKIIRFHVMDNASYIHATNENNVTTMYIGMANGAKESYYDRIAYVRIDFVPTGSAATADDASMITSIINPDASGTVFEWYDTGLSPESASGGSGYVQLLVDVNKNKTDIANVSKRVTALETNGEAAVLTVPEEWEDAVEACIDKIKALQVGRSCITFPFFSDNHYRLGYSGMLIAKVMKECHIPYCFYAGDSISSGTIADEATMIEQDKAFDTIMSYVPNGRFCRTVGNHDGYWYNGTNKYYYNRDQIYDLFLREESISQAKHFGDDGTYYYIDEVTSKIRFIVLNTNGIRDASGAIVGSTFDSTQLAWLRDTALSFSESGWAVVFISHQPISNHYHSGITNAEEVISTVSDYINGTTSNKADVIGWFSGHLHRDRIYKGVAVNTSDDSIGEALPFTQVTITSDHTGIAYEDATKHTVANDDQSHAIDFVTVNRNTRTVNITRLGIGNDRSYMF